MSAFTANYQDAYCPAILQLAEEGCASSGNVVTSVGLMQFLLSPINSNSIIFEDTGKLRPVNITWSWRSTVDQVSSIYEPCVAGDRPNHRSFLVSPEMVSTIRKTFDEDDMRRFCHSMAPFMASEINNMLDAIRQDVNMKIHTQLAAVTTPLSNAAVAAPVDLYVGTPPNDGLNMQDLDRVQNSLMDISGSCTPAFVGNGDLRLASRAIGAGCCNDRGVNISNFQGEFMFFKDIHASLIHGANTFLAIAPGAIQLVTWNKNKGEYAGVPRGGKIERTILTDPLSGLELDLDILHDECDESYTITLTTNYTVVWIQNDRYSPTDPLFQTKGFIKYPQA